MVVQHFSPKGFSRKRDWARHAHEIMDKLKLSNKKVSALKFTNPPIVPGEVYIGKKALKGHKFKLFYIPPDLLSEEGDYVWAAFAPIRTQAHAWGPDEWYIPPYKSNTTRMSINLVDMDLNWIKDNTSYIKQKIERSYPEYISLTELKTLLRPIKFIKWMKEMPLEPK